jgi:hypothetical protein
MFRWVALLGLTILLKPLHGCATQASRVLSMAFHCLSTVDGQLMGRGSHCDFDIVMRNYKI